MPKKFGGETVDYRGRIVLRGNESFLVKGIDVNGVFDCIDINDLSKNTRTLHKVDPIIQTVYKTKESILGFNNFSYEDLQIFPTVNIEDIVTAYGYVGSSTHRGYIVVLECAHCSYIFEILNGEVYGAKIRNCIVDISDNSFDGLISRDIEFNEYSDLLEVPTESLYKYKYYLPVSRLILLERLFSDFPNQSKVELPILSGKNGSGVCLSLFNGSEYFIRTIKDLEVHLVSDGKILPEDIYESMKEVYDYPCAHFSDEEMDKLCGILEIHGYSSIIEEVRSNNGLKSNFKVPNSDDYVCIKDYEGGNTYTVNLLRLNDVRSLNGIILYTELRMYNLCKGADYIVLCSSIDRKVCETLQKLEYSNLIRGRLVRLKSFPYELTFVQDGVENASFRYTIRGEEDIYEAEYKKKYKKWKYIKESELGEDTDFLNVILQTLDKIAGISNYSPTRYSVYTMLNGKVSVCNDTCVGSESKFQNCRNLIRRADGTEFLIVKWDYEKRDKMWIFNKIEKSLVRL